MTNNNKHDNNDTTTTTTTNNNNNNKPIIAQRTCFNTSIYYSLNVRYFSYVLNVCCSLSHSFLRSCLLYATSICDETHSIEKTSAAATRRQRYARAHASNHFYCLLKLSLFVRLLFVFICLTIM